MNRPGFDELWDRCLKSRLSDLSNFTLNRLEPVCQMFYARGYDHRYFTIDKTIKSRLGRFQISNRYFEYVGMGVAQKILSEVIIVRSESRLDLRAIDYIGYSMHFEVVDLGTEATHYDIQMKAIDLGEDHEGDHRFVERFDGFVTRK